MSENLKSENIESESLNTKNDQVDYQNLITRLKEIKMTIALLEKTIFR